MNNRSVSRWCVYNNTFAALTSSLLLRCLSLITGVTYLSNQNPTSDFISNPRNIELVSRDGFPRLFPRFSLRKSTVLGKVRAVRITREREREREAMVCVRVRVSLGERVFPDFPLGLAPRAARWSPAIEWDIGNFILGCQGRRTKRVGRRASYGGGCKPCISFFPFNNGMRNDLGEADRPKKVQ